MNAVLRYDSFIIRLFEAFALNAERVRNINCFGLARLCFILCEMLACIRQPDTVGRRALLGVIVLFFIYLFERECALRRSKNPSVKNPLKRDSTALLRLILLLGVILVGALSLIGTGIFYGAAVNGVTVLFTELLLSLGSWMFGLAAVYFVSCDPPTPAHVSKQQG